MTKKKKSLKNFRNSYIVCLFSTKLLVPTQILMKQVKDFKVITLIQTHKLCICVFSHMSYFNVLLALRNPHGHLLRLGVQL